MNEFTLLSSILRRAWLIDPAWVDSNLPLVASIIRGEKVSFHSGKSRVNQDKVMVLYRPFGATIYQPDYYSGFDKAPAGSLAQIDLIGPVMKYGFCGDGSYELNQQVKQAAALKNILGAFFNIDSPGGQVDGTATLGDTVFNFGKPTLSFVNDGMMNSAATWIGTSADEVYASQPLDSIGGVGVYQTVVDRKDQLKKLGIKRIDRYAPQSTDKNKSSRDASAGDFTTLDQELFDTAAKFISTIEGNRGDRLQGDPEEWNAGKTGNADWAQKVGLIDGIMPYEAAADRLEQLTAGAKPKRAVLIKSAQSNNPDMNFKLLASLAGKTQVSQAELDAVNAELATAGITGFGVYPETLINESAAVTKDLETANAKVIDLETKLGTANEKLSEANNNLVTSQASVITLQTRLSNAPAATAPAAATTETEVQKTEAQIAQDKMDALPHNAAIANDPRFNKPVAK